MKLPTIKQLAEIIVPTGETQIWFKDYDKSHHWPSRGCLLDEEKASQVAEQIIGLIKQEQFEESPDTPQVDQNLVRIAELEAKLYVYESIIESAGIKLGMPVQKTEIGFKTRKEK